jgi:predicted ArsR family transcriptional regulator
MTQTPLPPDQLNTIGVLVRREVEARLLAPLVQALGAEFGMEQVLRVVREVILDIARQQGAELAQNGSSLSEFAASLENWKKDDAMQIEVLEQSEKRFSFNVHRCRYAEMYAKLGVPELGTLLSCNRDAALIEGFNPHVKLTRTQTIMQGDLYCDFRYELEDDS